ncbi:protein-tyrosine phosphatase-like protein, partial [Bombardia bombarda]
IEPGLFIGDLASAISIPILMAHHITAIVSLLHVAQPAWARPANRELVPARNHMFVQCDDSPAQDILCSLNAICDFIDAHLGRPKAMPDLKTLIMHGHDDEEEVLMEAFARAAEPGKVLVHCCEGVSRSATAVVAYLMRKHERRLGQVLADVKRRRGRIAPSRSFMEQLRVWEEVEYEVWEDEARTVPKEAYRRWLDRR